MKKKLFRITTVAGSINVLLRGQLKFLSQAYDITAIASGSDILNVVATREGVSVKNIPMAREISPFLDIYSLFYLYFYFLKEKPYIVHANTPKASLLSMIAAFFAFVPHRVYMVTGLRFETTHGVIRFILISIERLTCFFSNKVIPEGKGVRDKLILYKITSKPLSVIHNGNINGVDTRYFDKAMYLSKYDISPFLKYKKDITFIFIGRLVKDKGISELYLAFKEFQKHGIDSSLILLGRYETSSNSLDATLVHDLKNDENVFSLGFQKDIRPFLAIADVFLFPSHREGFPNVLLQAASMSLPLISTEVNGANEVINDGVNGFLIPIGDYKSLLAKMLFFWQNKDQISIMGQKCREKAVNYFKQEDVWNEILNTYNNL